MPAGTSRRSWPSLRTSPLGRRSSHSTNFRKGNDSSSFSILVLLNLEEGDILYLDEPDNFISVREVQPWLAELDRVP